MNSPSDMWNEICFLLSENVKPHFSEKDYENQVVRALEVLGWREFRNEIERQPTIHLGREGTLRPDLIIYNQNKHALFVIEVKRPSEDITKDNTIGQLRSYMRQMKSDFGFLIGSELRVYYDGTSNQQPDPLLLEKIPFSRNSEGGIEFINNFAKESFIDKKYVQYLETKIRRFNRKKEINNLLELLTSEDVRHKIVSFLRKEFADFGDDTFSEVMKRVSISVAKKDATVFTQRDKSTSVRNQNQTRKNRRKIVRSINPVIQEVSGEISQPLHKIATVPFESHLETRLRHIYGVLYFMKQGSDFSTATHQTLKLFPEVQDYQTISDKCARGFAGSVDTFVMWLNSGEILNKLMQKFKLSDHDYDIFKNLLSS